MEDYSGVFQAPSPIKPTRVASGDYSSVFDSKPLPQIKQDVTQQGFFNYTKNFLVRGYKMYEMTQGRIDPTDQDQIQMMTALADPIQGQKMKDFGSLFGELTKNVGAQVKGAAIRLKEQGLSIKDLPGFSGQFLKGLEKPIGDLAELATGVQFTTDDIKALTPEDKRERVKNVVATGVMLGVGKATAAGIGALGMSEGAVAAGAVTRGTLARKLLANATVGATAGASYGIVEGAGEEDQLARVITDGIFGAGLGTAWDLTFGGTGRKLISGTKQAGEIAQVRQLQSTGNTVADNIRTASAINSAENIPEAIMQGRAKPGGVTHITGLSGEEVSQLTTSAPEGFGTAHHFDKSGESGSVLLYDKMFEGNKPSANKPVAIRQALADLPAVDHQPVAITADGTEVPLLDRTFGRVDPNDNTVMTADGQTSMPMASVEVIKDADGNVIFDNRARAGIDTKFFAENGFLRDQVVSHNGVEYSVTGGDGKHLTIEQLNGTGALTIPRESVRATPATETTTPRSMSTILQELHEERRQHAMIPRSGGRRIGDVINDSYKEWRASTEQVQEPSPTGEPKPEPIDLMDHASAPDLLKHMDDFLASKNMDPADAKMYKREFQHRLASEAETQLEPEEREIIRVADKERSVDARTGPEKIKDMRELTRVAKSNGMTVTDGGSGRVIVRDLQTRRILGGFDDNAAAADWINRTGQAEGPTLDANGSVDTGVAGGGRGIPPNEPVAHYPQDNPYNFFGRMKNVAKAAVSEEFIRGLDNVPFITRYRDYLLGMDRKYGTKLHERIVEPINKTRNMRNALLKPYADEFGKIHKASRFGAADAKEVGDYMQTMSPDEVAERGMARPMKPVEKAMAHRIVDAKVDVERVFTYRREVGNLDREFPAEKRAADPRVEQEYQTHLNEAKQAYSMDDNHMNIAGMFDSIENMNMNEASLGAVVRYARALDNGAGAVEMSQGEFAAKRLANPQGMAKINAANQLAALYDKLAGVFGIEKKRMMGGFMTHARLYADGDVPKAMSHFSGDLKAKEFYAKMARTGEISAYEDNAFKAMMRYMKAGFDVHSGFADAVAMGQRALEEEILKMPGNAQGQVRAVAQRYMNDVQGFPEAGDRAAQEAVDYMMNKFKLGDDVNVRRAWVNGTANLINSAALGVRPMLGIGHFGISTILSISARGFGYTKRMLSNGASAIHGEAIMTELQEKGVFQGLSPFAAMRVDEGAPSIRSRAGAAVDVAQEAMFKATLLPTVYDGMAAGHYLTTYGDALSALTKFGREEMTWNQLKKATYLDRYDQPIIDRFKALAKDNPVDASHYLGMQAVEDLVGTYGSGSHPYMWGTNIGRVAGQFGNFAMWIRATTQRMASRGTVAQRFNSIAKLTALSYATVKGGEELGVDMSRMSPLHAMTWMFGPMVHIAQDAAETIHGSGYQQKAAQRRLMRMLPIDGQGNFQPSLFVPASFAIDGLIKAADDFSKGNAVLGTAEALGFRPGQKPKPGGL